MNPAPPVTKNRMVSVSRAVPKWIWLRAYQPRPRFMLASPGRPGSGSEVPQPVEHALEQGEVRAVADPGRAVHHHHALVGHVADQHPCDPRSEEHTSELQSRVELVCRLLLEKTNRDRSALSLHAPTKVPSRKRAAHLPE